MAFTIVNVNNGGSTSVNSIAALHFAKLRYMVTLFLLRKTYRKSPATVMWVEPCLSSSDLHIVEVQQAADMGLTDNE